MKNLVLVNGQMNIRIIACIGDNAFLKRLNDSSFIVVNGLNIHNDFTCEWNFAYIYTESYNQAYTCFTDKILKPAMEYRELIEV